MHALQQFIVKDQSLCLSADRSVFWEQEKALIVSDLHFAKSGHFRKAGIAVPHSVFKEDMQRLVAQIQYFDPSVLIVVGDMFHSYANRELELFSKWRADFKELPIRLVRGNHDILPRSWYNSTGIEVFETTMNINKFSFRHDPKECRATENREQYSFCGHLHPGITIRGAGKQALHFPCFYFSATYCILPAFGRFTGTVNIEPDEGDTIFAIVNNSIVKVR